MTPSTAAVCVTYNNANTIADLMNSLARQENSVSQLIVVDNGSSDNTVDVVNSASKDLPFAVDLIAGANIGFAAGIDLGAARVANPDVAILVVNPDVVLCDGIVSKMYGLLNAIPDAAIVTAPLTLGSGEPDPASRRSLPTTGRSMLYAVLGRFTPRRMRYNAGGSSSMSLQTVSAYQFSEIEATTGALMLVRPTFRNSSTGIFDTDYWMYGEDLQLCFDAATAGNKVLMLEVQGSVHIKGVSSGLPRTIRADREFHRAMYFYYRKNLSRNVVERVMVYCAVWTRFGISRAAAQADRWRSNAE